MAETLPLVVTDGRVLLGGDLEEDCGLAVIPRDLRIGTERMRSDEQLNVIRSIARQARDKGRLPEVLPPQREHFLNTYTMLAEQHAHVVSVHFVQGIDSAAREARVCRQLMQPRQLIDVYEANTLEGGLEFLLSSTAKLAAQGASAAQVLALLRYLETHMLTLLLTPRPASRQPWAACSSAQRLLSLMPTMETLWHFDPKQRKLVIVGQGKGLHRRLGRVLEQRWGRLRHAAILRYRGYARTELDSLVTSLQAAGLAEEPRVDPVAATFLPCAPQRFVELLLIPTEADLLRLQALVQDPIWWKGGA